MTVPIKPSQVLLLTGRILLSSAQPALVTAQLGGQNLTLAQASLLRDDISTDEIRPVRF